MPLTGFEPVTLALLAPCSNQLSYKGVPPLSFDLKTSCLLNKCSTTEL